MDWQDHLIELYCSVCEATFKSESHKNLRGSNNWKPKFTDEEVLTTLYYGIQLGLSSLKAIHTLLSTSMRSWFPEIPDYKQFSRRVGNLHSVMADHVECLSSLSEWNGELGFLMDSMPIVSAKRNKDKKRNIDAVCSFGYCASKKMHYYGVKLHMIAERSLSGLPRPNFASISGANEHDLSHFKLLDSTVAECEIYADKAYCHQSYQNDIALEKGVLIATPIKKMKGKENSSWIEAHNKFISHIRQPIESLFADLAKKTDIQRAYKVRSVKGLLAHIYGRLAAYMFTRRVAA